MSELRPFALIRDGDQWVRGAFDRVFLDYAEGIVELAWTTPTRESTTQAPRLGGGLAFDHACRLFHSDPDTGRVDLLRWGARDPYAPGIGADAPVSFFAEPLPATHGDFVASAGGSALREPRGLAVDDDDRLFVAASGDDSVLVFDLWGQRLVRRVALRGGRPTDLAARAGMVWAVLAGARRVVTLTAGGGPAAVDLPSGCVAPSRVAVSPGGALAVLCDAGTASAEIWILGTGGTAGEHFPESYATDIEWESSQVLVVARRPGADFLRLRVGAPARELVGPLRARGYDGLGIVRTPDRLSPASGHQCRCGGACACGGGAFRIGYWSARGFRLAVPARLLYQKEGRVTTYRLDSGAFQTQWGRVFLDACIPRGTTVRVHALALDQAEDVTELGRTLPANLERVTVPRPDLSPPMPPLDLAPGPGAVTGLLHERESGRELPWSQPATDDPFRTYEGWLDASAGRYLWLTLELRGNTRLSPRVRCIRAEHPAHDYLRRLPKVFSRRDDTASFLRRYLAIPEGFLGETEARGVDRDILLTPGSTPDAALPWLASFLGLVLDERWARAPRPGGCTADARREIIAAAAWLFRFRGTVMGLRRFIELYVGTGVILLEHFRFRGGMSAMLGATGAALSSSVLGAGFRVGRAAGDAAGPTGDPWASQAHRFTVLIPAALTEEQLDVVRRILEIHRPAHTMFDVCTVGAGMRVGRGLHVGVSSIVGPTGGFATLQLGGGALGRNAILGRPSAGTTPGASRVGTTARVR